jgi:hypothetical protein
MKAFKHLSLAALLLFAAFNTSRAQNDNRQTYHIHEDKVLPSMVGEYEAVAKELTDNVKKYNIPGMKWILTQTNDLRYLYVSPISKMADLDDDAFWDSLRGKMGAEKFTDLFNRMNKCYDVHTDYIITLDKDLSYMPGGINLTPAGQDYRRFYYMYSTPQNMAKLTEALKNVKALFQQKGSKMEYRIYRSGFGANGAFYMVAIAAKDGGDFEAMDAANNKLIGPDAEKLFGDMMKYVTRIEEVTARMRPDLAYTPK